MKTLTKNISALILSVAVASVSFAPAAFAGTAYITLDSFSGTPGSSITTSGGGWTAGDTLDIYFNTVSGTSAGATTIKSDGSFSLPVTIPAATAPGPLPVIAIDTATHGQESNSYYVNPLSPSITITAPSHAPYASVSVSGSGFAPNETVDLGLAGATATALANASGSFTGTITIPVTTVGLYHLSAVGASSGASVPSYSNYFWIDGFYPSVTPSAYYLMPGATLSFTGSGFAPGETISVTADSGTSVLSTITAGASGAFSAAGGFAIPVSLAGTAHTFTLKGAKSGASASANVTIGNFYPYASPSTYYLTPGSVLAFQGGGFAANEQINVYQGTGSSTLVATFSTDANGSFTTAGSVTIPYSASGTQISYTLIGASSHAQTSVTTSVGAFYPSITPASYYVVPNTSLIITGSGFAPNETVTLSSSGATSTSATTDAKGNFSGSITVPFSKTGSATIEAIGSLSKTSTSVGITLASFFGSVAPSSYFVYPGEMISYRGTGFAPNETVTVSSSSTTSTITADSLGGFRTASSTIPFTTSGSITTIFTGSLSGATAVTTVAIGSLSPYLSSDSYSAQQGGTIHVTGNGFAPGEMVNVSAGSFTMTTTANAAGVTPAVAITAPYNASSFKVVFTGAGSGASASLSVALAAFNPQVSPSTYYTTPGTTITFTGTGFVSNEQVDVTFNGAVIAPRVASSSGAFSYSYTPGVSSKAAVFTFTGETSGATQSITITLAPFLAYVQLSTYYAQGGSPLTITGSGFAPGESVTLKGNDTTFATATADTSGNLSYTGTVPFAPAGTLVINAVGNSSGASATATMTLPPVYTNLQLGSYAGAPGSAIDFIGSGYLPNETIAIRTDRTGSSPVYTFTADGSGSFNNSGYTIPANWTGGPLVLTASSNHSFSSTPITYYVTGQ
jgi:hypothetical protein